MRSKYDYRLEFENIKLGFSQVMLIDYQNPEPQYYKVFLDDKDMGVRVISHIPNKVSDVIDLAIAVYAADRILKSSTRERLRIHIILPVRRPQIMNSTTVLEKLQITLAQYTEHTWEFTFLKRECDERSSALQHTLPLYQNAPLEIALWSGGLDALAGFLNRLFNNPEKHFVLFGTGSNTSIHSLQGKLRVAVEQRFPSRSTLVRIPYAVRKIDRSLPSRPLLRSRGFTFTLLGAVCAYLHGQRKLHIYENGLGAINLPFRQSETGLDHSRAVHPLSLHYLANLLTEIFDEQFELVNPFLFSTKAQMCEIFQHADYGDLIAHSITCDHIHRNVSGQAVMQCGRCSSCVLRRQALAAAEINDETLYVYEDFFPDSIKPVGGHDHLPAVLNQVEALRKNVHTASPWKSLRHQYPTLSLDVVDRASQHIKLEPNEIIEHIIQLYRQYVFEWDKIKER